MTKSLCQEEEEVVEEEDNELQQKYKHLKRDWDAYKQSTTRHRRRHTIASLKATALESLYLLDSSPKKLLTSLQENWLPIEDRKVKKDDHLVKELEICSVCSSVLIQGSGVESTCSFSSVSSSDDGFGYCAVCADGVDGCYYSSSSSFSALEIQERDQAMAPAGATREKSGGDINGGRWMVRMGWLAIILVVLELGIIWLMDFNVEGDGGFLIPT